MSPTNNNSKVRHGFIQDRLIVVITYISALVIGGWSMQFVSEHDTWVQIGVADLVATVVVFVGSVLFKNSSLYDPYWSVIPIAILLYWMWLTDFPLNQPRVWMISIVVFYWGIRLTANWLKTWPGLNHEDWRYKKLAQDMGVLYWPVSFLGIHLFPTVLVFLACLPIESVVTSSEPLMWVDVLGFLVAFIAVEIERRADNQLRVFKAEISDKKSSVCQIGLWKYSRHPNYFGEILFWAGLFMMSLGLTNDDYWIYGVGTLSMMLLFQFISIPMMEKRQLRKAGYSDYQKKVSRLAPWFRKG